MRQSKFTETQIISILKEADAGRPVNEIWRKYGISSATTVEGLYTRQSTYGHLRLSFEALCGHLKGPLCDQRNCHLYSK